MAAVGKGDLSKMMADKLNVSSGQANKTVEALLESIAETLEKGDEVRIPGFGTFKVMETKARTGRHPRTGEPLQIAAGKRVSFSASPKLLGGEEEPSTEQARPTGQRRTQAA